MGEMSGPERTPRSSGLWPIFQATLEGQKVKDSPSVPSLESQPCSIGGWLVVSLTQATHWGPDGPAALALSGA